LGIKQEDKAMNIMYKGKPGTIIKQRFYCKAGAYEHKWRMGWVLVVDGNPVLGNRVSPTNVCDGSSRFDYPEYKTRKALLQDIEYLEQEEIQCKS
jgi:hypothetical protein